MRPYTSPLDHLTAFAIVFVSGVLAAVSFVACVERARRNAVADYCKRTNSELKYSASPVHDGGING